MLKRSGVCACASIVSLIAAGAIPVPYFADVRAASSQLRTITQPAAGSSARVRNRRAADTVPTGQPPARSTLTPQSGGDLQQAIDDAQPGDTILLTPGEQYTGNYLLPVKSGSGTITIRSAAPDWALPDANTRVDPSYADQLPKLQSPNSGPVFTTAPGAHGYTLQFLEFLPTAGGLYDMLALGDGSSNQNTLDSVPYDLVIDRCYFHGDPSFGQHRAIALNSGSTTIANSYISDIKAEWDDSQGINGWNGPGPYVITNNYVEAAGENILFGGSDPSIPGLIPSDILISRNVVSKPLAWREQPQWSPKNLVELKNAARVTIDGNVIENNWEAAQTGYAIVLTPRNQDGTCPWCNVQQVQISNNVVRHVGGGINILGTDDLQPSGALDVVVIRNNLFDDVSWVTWGGDGRFLQIGQGAADVSADHNTVMQDGSSAVFAYGLPMPGFAFSGNIVPDNSWCIVGDSVAAGNDTIAAFFPGGVFMGNIFAGSDPASYPADNYYPASYWDVGFVDLAGGNYRLSDGSPYSHDATGQADVGCDFDALDAATGLTY